MAGFENKKDDISFENHLDNTVREIPFWLSILKARKKSKSTLHLKVSCALLHLKAT